MHMTCRIIGAGSGTRILGMTLVDSMPMSVWLILHFSIVNYDRQVAKALSDNPISFDLFLIYNY